MIEEILKELKNILAKIPEEDFSSLYSILKKSKKIYICGAGRSGIIGKSFAIRLRHLGKESYVIGETICPPIGKNDCFIAISCSGARKNIINLAYIAKKQKSQIVTLTSNKNSTLSKISDKIIFIPKDKSIQFGNSQFEQAVFIFLEAFVLFYQKKGKISFSKMGKRHTNLE